MKVLHLIGGGDNGGAKIHVFSLVKELSKHIEVKIISFRGGEDAEEARSLGINIEVIHTGSVLKDAKRVAEIISTEGYQIVHSHGAKANMMSVLLKRLVHIPTVTTVHSDYKLDYLHSKFKALTYGKINSMSFRIIDFRVAVSNNFKRMLEERNFDPQKIFTVYNGIDFKKELKEYNREEFSTKYNLSLKDDELVVGLVARLHPVKGVSVFIKAACEILKKNPKVKFLVAGEGEERASLENLIKSLGLEDKVYLLGFLNDPYELIANSDINVLTSLSESFPYAILEGCMFRKPTISSDVGGISDLIEHNENGYLFEAGDYKSLAGYVLELLEDENRREEFGRRLYEKASTTFSLENMCATQLEIYEKILKVVSVGQRNRIRGSKRKYDVMLSGWYGFNNIGDDAILRAIINDLRNLKKDISIVVLSKKPQETSTAFDVDSISRLNLCKITKIMKNSKLFINGGGTLIQDLTSTRSLMYYLGTIFLAKCLGMKVMVYANGIGPVNKRFNRRLTRKILNKVDTITLREECSRAELKRINICNPNISVTADPALNLDEVQDSVIDDIFKKEGIVGPGPFVGFSVRKWGDGEKYTTVIAELADYMVEKYDIKPLFIPMQFPNDFKISKQIARKMRSEGRVISEKYSEIHTAGIIKRMDMLIGMRLHALIFAAGYGIPVLGLVYEPKIEGFLKYIGQESACAGHVKDLELDKLREIADQVWNNRTSIRECLLNESFGLKDKGRKNAEIALELLDTVK
jgi:L-malate glycosyltransferase